MSSRRGRPPSRNINFVAAHDGFTLRDLVSYRSKHNLSNGEDNRDGSSDEISWNNGAEVRRRCRRPDHRRRDVRALLATLMVARGTPMLTAGDEFGRTQQGNNNAYAQDNETTWLDWKNADDERIEFVSRLAELRRSGRFMRVPLRGLTVDEVQRMMSIVRGQEVPWSRA
jgi:glycogen operon protein